MSTEAIVEIEESVQVEEKIEVVEAENVQAAEVVEVVEVVEPVENVEVEVVDKVVEVVEVKDERPKVEPPPVPEQKIETNVESVEEKVESIETKTEKEIEAEKSVDSVATIQTNGDVKAELAKSEVQPEVIKEEIENPDPPRRKRNKFCQCC